MPRRGLSRAAVVDAAARIADAEGLDNVTVARVASELGVKPPSLYNHVESHDGLMRELSLRGLRELGGAITQSAVGRSRDEALLAVSKAHRSYALAHPGLYAATIRAATAGEDRERTEAADAVLNVIYAVLAGYGVEGEDAVHATRALRSALHGFSSIESSGGFGLPADREKSFELMVETLAAGISARG